MGRRGTCVLQHARLGRHHAPAARFESRQAAPRIRRDLPNRYGNDMTEFEYLAVLVSLILGLGIIHLLAGVRG